jgi:hypothetical protein
MAGNYLETFLDGVIGVPADIQRKFKLMRELDGRLMDLTKKIEEANDDYLSCGNRNGEEGKSILEQIRR